ncbi:MAG TPA: GTPase Era [Bacteroidia bacterium]|nr:GTPase Era [Bacteroidia bacterium]
MHKAGFVNIIGCPNVGKSTLLNALVGERLSVITSKAQTTRHRIMGIVSEPGYQIIFSDTPGILKPNYKLHEKMMRFVADAMEDADVFLLITDVYEDIQLEQSYIDRLKKVKQPVLVLINKIDLVDMDKIEARVAQWHERLPNAEILPVSALEKTNLGLLMQKILSLLPEHEAYFDKNELTDKPERFFVCEIIREKILLNYKKEIPYSCEVVVESFKEEEKIIRIEAVIYVERDSQKGIIIGHQGAALKKVGIEARKDCETFFGKQIHLQTFVKVDKDWRSNEKRLKNFGY